MPHKYNINITPVVTGSSQLRGIPGTHLHGLIFSLIAEINPDLADRLHISQEKPFSLWPVWKADGSINVIVTTLSDDLANALDIIENNKPGYLGRTLIVINTQKIASFFIEEMWNRAENIDSIDTLRINFLSATSFRRAGKQWLFPDPDVVFHNVFLKAIEVFGEYFQNNLSPPTEYATQFMVSRYELATKQLDYGRYKIIGFSGYCVYDCRRIKLAYNCQSLAFLSELAEFTGIGYKTTMGMGRAECLIGKEHKRF